MNLDSEGRVRLMAYVDGELDDHERRAVEELLAANDEAYEFVEQVASLGSIVKDGYDERFDVVMSGFDVAEAVLAKADQEPPRASMLPGVSSIDVARERRRQRTVIGAAFVATLAVAASVFLFARPSEAPMAEAPVAPQPTEAPRDDDGAGVDVRAVESPGQNVSVFYLPSANELSTSVVVWVEETGDK